MKTATKTSPDSPGSARQVGRGDADTPAKDSKGRANNLRGILVFLQVVDAGSLSAAARGLGVSTSAVSAALARLERRLETRLVHRTTRRLSMTADGEEFYRRCKKIVLDLEAAEETLGAADREPTGTL